MSRYSRGLFAVVAPVVLATAAACGPTASEPGGDSTAGSGQTSAAPPAVTLPTNGKCVLITAEKATALLGGSVTSSASSVDDEDGFVRIDGCAYSGSAGANLGYDINDISTSGTTPSTVVTQAKAAMAGQPGVTPFDVTGGDASVAFTMAIGGKVMARVEVAKGPYTVAVNSTAPDADTAKKISTGALAILLAALG
jgi:hypothetical protein